MRILVTGGSGFVGQALCARLAGQEHELLVVSRSPGRAAGVLPEGTRIEREVAEFVSAEPEAIVNLAGEPIADGRWTRARKRRIIESRVETTGAIVDLCKQAQTPPRVLVSASAMGWYGDQGDREVTEDTPPNEEFAHEICAAWEGEAHKAEARGVRVAIARIGLVLGPGGGVLKRMLPPFRMGVGGRLGDGRQFMPWIALADMVRVLEFLIGRDDLSGPFNASAPHPVTNAEFTATLARVLNRPALLPVPAAALKLAFGEMSRLLLTGADMRPKRLQQAGFEFQHAELGPVLEEMV